MKVLELFFLLYDIAVKRLGQDEELLDINLHGGIPTNSIN